MLGSLQAHIFPGFSTILTAIDSVSVSHVPSAYIFSRTYPDGIGIPRINRDTADGVGALVVKNGLPGDAGIHRFPDIPGTHSHVPGLLITGMNGNIGNAAGAESRTNIPEFESRYQGRVDFGFSFLGIE